MTNPIRNEVIFPTRPATPKQIAFLRTLADQREVPTEGVAVLAARMASGLFTSVEASHTIDTWKTYPYKKRAPRKGAEPGYYYLPSEDERCEGRFIVVVENKAKTGTYAKVLTQQVSIDVTRWAWEYQKGLAFQVADLTPLTIEQAKAWGKLHGHCIICARPLTDPASVEAGVGPVCAKRIQA